MGDPSLSPDAAQVLLRITDSTADGAKSHLWLIDTKGGAPRQLTFSPDSDKRGERNGEWMPDGSSILFIARRGERPTLYRLPMNGGEATAIGLKINPVVDESRMPGALPPTKASESKDAKAPDSPEEVPLAVANFRISPDGKTIALIAEDPEPPGEKKQKDAKADASWVDHDPHGARLYLLDIASNKLTSAGLPIDVRAAEWSPDSTSLIVQREEPNGASELGPAGSVWLVNRSDPSAATRLPEIPPTADALTWSTDGATLYYLAQARHDAPPGYSDLYSDTLATHTTQNLTDGFMGSLTGTPPIALKQGAVLVSGELGLESKLIRLVPPAGKPQFVDLPFAVLRSIKSNASQSGWVLQGASGGKVPQLLFASSLDATPKPLSLPSLIPANLTSIAPRRIFWTNDGLSVDGMLYLPQEAATRKVPLIVEVHGGPLGAYLDDFSVFSDFLLGHGWAVLRTNPRGSTGRGAAFAAANKNDLGGGDYRDVMAGVDFVLKTQPAIDPGKLALIGYSYGGEMAGFVEGKTTRFKAIVSAAPVIDQNSEYGTERGSWYDQWYFGKPWEHQADAWRQSPLAGAGKARTPFMLIQGESDTTDPLGQAQEMYRALKQMKVPVDLITYPREDHGPLATGIYGNNPSPEPWHGFDARRRIVQFFRTAFGESAVDQE